MYATARNEEALKALAEEAAAGTKGGVVKVCTLDQSDDAAVQDFVEQVKSGRESGGPVGEQRVCRTDCHDPSLWQAFLGKAPLCV